MFEIIDCKKLENYKKGTSLDIENKNVLDAIEFIIDITNSGLKLFFNELTMEHQNTNLDNYHFILKDFISDVNKTAEKIIDSVKLLYKNIPDIIVNKPIIFGHQIKYIENENYIKSITIQELYIEYINHIAIQGHEISKLLRRQKSDLEKDFNNRLNIKTNSNDDVILYDENNLFENRVQSKRELLISRLGKKLKMYLKKNEDFIDENKKNALLYFIPNDNFNEDFVSAYMYHSINLYDEKILNKCEHVYYCELNGKTFEVVGKNVIDAKKKSISCSYSFKSDFDIIYYIKRMIIEEYTKKDFISFMSIYKDFLSNYNYLNYCDKKNFKQTHPMIIEANLLDEVKNQVHKYEKKLKMYKEKISEIRNQSKDCLIVTKNIKEYCDILIFPEQTKKYFMNKFNQNKEPTIEEFTNELDIYSNKIINSVIDKILDTEEKKLSYKTIIKTFEFLEQSIFNLYNKLYYEDQAESTGKDFDKNRFFNKRDKATFHTTLKDSFIIDHRNGRDIKSEHNEKYAIKEQIEKISSLLKTHKYHDYIEIDKDLFSSNDSIMNIEDIIFFLEKTNNFNYPVPQKCALKFRKLGKYKALGIYFSFSKNLGIDYRKGKGSYIHEMAHHIDLNTNITNRKYMVNLLHNYFSKKIFERVDYYLKSEELIARAAEISLLLLLGRYYYFKEYYDRNEIDAETLILAIKNAFNKSTYSEFMGKYEDYKDTVYIDFEKEILNKNFKFLEMILIYFKAFWSGKELNIKDERIISSNINIEYNNENKFVKKNEYSYGFFYRDIFKNRVVL